MESHLLQMRGLKHIFSISHNTTITSHLLQMRGLKRWCITYRRSWFRVASFTDAWIETPSLPSQPPLARCRIFYRCVDWNLYPISLLRLLNCRIFYRCVDWNTKGLPPFLEGICRIFYRCVDWNYNMQGALADTLGRIFYRCVDWNCIFAYCMRPFGVASFTDAWIETIRTVAKCVSE